MPMVKWIYSSPNLDKQINLVLLAGTVFMILYALFDWIQRFSGDPVSSAFKAVSGFSAAFLFVQAVLLSKKWIDKKYGK